MKKVLALSLLLVSSLGFAEGKKYDSYKYMGEMLQSLRSENPETRIATITNLYDQYKLDVTKKYLLIDVKQQQYVSCSTGFASMEQEGSFDVLDYDQSTLVIPLDFPDKFVVVSTVCDPDNIYLSGDPVNPVNMEKAVNQSIKSLVVSYTGHVGKPESHDSSRTRVLKGKITSSIRIEILK